MEEVQEKMNEVRNEWSVTIMAFSEYTNSVLKRAQELINSNGSGATKAPKEQKKDDAQKIVSDLASLVEKCRSFKNDIDCLHQAPPRSDVVLQEVNPSISSLFECESHTDQSAHAIPQGASQTYLKLKPRFAGDDHRGYLPLPQDIARDNSPSPKVQTADDGPPSFSMTLTPEISSSAFNFSAGQGYSNLFSVKLSHPAKLKENVRTKLTNIQTMFVPSTIFDRDQACFKPACNGVYSLNVELCQYGHGEIDVWLCRQGHVSYMGKTKGNMTESSVMKVKPVMKGQDHWVEVRTIKGQPSVYWCNFSGFLIEKAPEAINA